MIGRMLWAAGLAAFAAALPHASFAADDPRGSTGSIHEEAKLPVTEEHTVSTLPKGGPHRVYVVDPVFPHLIASKTWIIDADKKKIVGMFNSGYLPNVAIAPDHERIYVAETFWSRGVRGERSDVVSTFDARTLTYQGEVVLPQGRFLVVPKRHDADLTPDGRYLLSFNMSPATTISVVDVKEQKYVGEVEIPGCAHVLASAPNRFSSLCADGSMLTATFDENAKASVVRSDPFFDAEKDPVFEHTAWDKAGAMAHMVSYSGQVYSADLSGETPKFSGPWRLQNNADMKQKWRPGGWHLLAQHRAMNRMYVLMHQGGNWTHKQAATEVWAYDLATKKRVQRIKLKDHAITVAVSQDDNPQLYTLSETKRLDIWNAKTGKHLGEVENIGDSPYLLMVEGN